MSANADSTGQGAAVPSGPMPPTRHTASIRRAMTATLVVLGLVAALVALALTTLSTQLGKNATTLDSAVEGLRIAEAIGGDLLQHSRSDVPTTQTALEAEVASLLAAARRYSTSADEDRSLDELKRKIGEYFAAYHAARAAGLGAEEAAGRASASLSVAFTAARRYGDAQVAEARAAQAQASTWNTLANWIGAAAFALALLVVAAAVAWLRRSAFRPVLHISESMQRFSAGDRTSRAPIQGPEELRLIAHSFNEMALELSEQQQRQLAMVASAAHDLRNPISALQLSAARLDPKRAPLTLEQAGAMGALINRQLALLNRMTEDLLDAARIGAGKLDLKLQQRDLRQLASESVELFEGSASAHELDLTLPDGPVPLRADPVRIEQVLNNLLSNAIKYSPAGSRIAVRVASQGGEALVSVRDEGVGVSPEELPHLFEPFRRTGASRESAVPGVGLGLFVTKRIVEQHGGRLEVTSTLGKGSTFTVYLPLAQPSPGGG